MSGDEILNELINVQLAKADESFAKVFTQTAARGDVPEGVVRAATVGILCANGAWNQVQAIRAINETKADANNPGTGIDRIDAAKVTAYGPFGKMLKSMYEKGVAAGNTPDIGLMRALYEVAKDIAQVTKAIERAT